jgi:hypothetical protein
VLDFWFGLPGAPEWNISRREWFTKCVNFDTTVRGALPVVLAGRA